jgi:predicted nucleic acid-binding protein
VKLRLYLDTSVLCVNFDERSPERRALTEAFFERRVEFELSTSELTRQEIESTLDPNLRNRMLGLLEELQIHAVSDEMKSLAARYRKEGIFSPAMEADSVHVAAAVLSRQQILISWNFKHLVNRRRRSLVNFLNESLGLPSIEILSPPEV